MSEAIIRVENLGKCYRVHHEAREPYTTLRDVIARKVRGVFRTSKSDRPATGGDEDFWALKDVSFEVNQGEVVGIIGRNGAGKSTLLKILSRITEPTKGRVTLKGRVASLLEVGTGFHPELTGRENIFLNGAILGMSRAEIKAKFDEIVAFAEVEKFLDTPVKRYSSGMYVRLAFAVAAHLEPEILVVDEVLAVGDAQFQKKCLGKMQEVSKGGRTVLFVSHNMAAVSQLTDTSIMLSNGRIQFFGPTARAIEIYLNAATDGSVVNFDVERVRRKYPGSQAARILSFAFPRLLPIFDSSEDIVFRAKLRANEDFSYFRFSMTVFAADGSPVGSCFGDHLAGFTKGAARDFEIRLPNPRLAPGQYHCAVSIGKGDHKTGYVDYDVVQDTLHFEIRPEEGDAGALSIWPKGWGNVRFHDLSCVTSSNESVEA